MAHPILTKPQYIQPQFIPIYMTKNPLNIFLNIVLWRRINHDINDIEIYSVIQLFLKENMITSTEIPLKKRQNSDTFDSLDFQDNTVLNQYQKYVFHPDNHKTLTPQKICERLVQYALQNQVDHYSFLSFPYNSTACQKQESLIDLKYIYDDGLIGKPRLHLTPDLLLKGEADGSSFPSGGLRSTHRARAYTLWDRSSEIFIRKKNRVMYIPALLLTHSGQALDDMTIFKKSENVMKKAASDMLTALGIQHKEVILALGLQQEFFVIPKNAYLLRQDLRLTGRCLFGRIAAKNQQFSDHYYGKMPTKIQEILKQVQRELLQIGIPFKTKHNQVANNQFEFCSIYEDAGKAIFHNLITMQILKETFDRHGYAVLLHQKPFLGLNGSGKHANWSINYVKPNGDIKNLFSVPSEQDQQLFRLFVLITLMAIKRNNPLYFGSIAPPGNQIRLGGHEAPPRIISAYLGQTVSSIIDGKNSLPKKNLRDQVFNLPHDVYQQDTDRNRTSPYAYTGHKFQFRALGSSQNPAFPMAVIAATLAKQFHIAAEKISKGYTCNELIQELKAQTQSVRFQGNGYSHQWSIQAKERGLYVNQDFIDILERMNDQCKVFVEVGACSQKQINARCQIFKDTYKLTAETQAKALINVVQQKVIPRAYAYLHTINVKSKFNSVSKYSDKFQSCFDEVLISLEELEGLLIKCQTLKDFSNLRNHLGKCGQKLGRLCGLLQKSISFPDLEDFLLL